MLPCPPECQALACRNIAIIQEDARNRHIERVVVDRPGAGGSAGGARAVMPTASTEAVNHSRRGRTHRTRLRCVAET